MQKRDYCMLVGGAVMGIILAGAAQWAWSTYRPVSANNPTLYPGSIVSGTLSSIHGNELTITNSVTGEEVKARIGGSTVIEHQVDKDPATLAQESADFQKQMSTYKSGVLPIPPLSYTTTALTVGDLHAGMLLEVDFAPGTDAEAAQRVAVLDHPATSIPSPIPAPPMPPAPSINN